MNKLGMLRKSMYCAGLLLAACCSAQAQLAPDTLRLTRQEAEQRFLEKNLTLLAAHYGVRADSALIWQARLWDNPTLSVDQNVYVEGQGFFHHGVDAAGNPTGQFYVQVQQLIQLGSKRRNAVQLAGANAGISQLQFEEMMRSLRLTLRQDLLNAAKLEQMASLYNAAVSRLDVLEKGISAQFDAGNVSRKDLLRVQGLLEGLRLQLAENARDAEDLQQELRTLLAVQGDTFLLPAAPAESLPAAMPSQSFDELLALALQHNTAYLVAAQQLNYQKTNYRYQRSLAVPDLEVGPNYDRASNFAPNYFGLTLGLPLPLWNRNQGNIRSAGFNVQQQEAALDAARLKLESELRSAYRNLSMAVNLASPVRHAFYEDYRQLFDKVLESYRARQISLIEFIDYLDSYEDIQEKRLQQQLNLELAKAALNYTVGVDVVR